jgi:hypothetical protein
MPLPRTASVGLALLLLMAFAAPVAAKPGGNPAVVVREDAVATWEEQLKVLQAVVVRLNSVLKALDDLAAVKDGDAKEAVLRQRAEHQIVELQDMLWWPPQEMVFEWFEVIFDKNGQPTVIAHREVLTDEQAEAARAEVEEQLQTVIDMAEMDLHDLQRIYGDYKAALDMLRAILSEGEGQDSILDNLDD